MAKKIRIGINGFGRIGRYFTRLSLDRTDIEVVAINDVAPIETLSHLFKYDSIHGVCKHAFTVQAQQLLVLDHSPITFTQFTDPTQIPWKELGVDLVIEATGLFLTKEKASLHLQAGAKQVILSAPPVSDDVLTVVLGVNDNLITATEHIISNASCTTNSAAPLIQVMQQLRPIESAYITTIHSYTTDQRLHDSPHKDLRRARAAGQSIVPTSTGAAKALTRIFPNLKDKLGGCGMRVPVPDGSLTDLTMIMGNPPSVDEINAAFLHASQTSLQGILRYTDEPIVSVDIIGDPHSCIFDSGLTSVIGNMVKVVAWYDNEAGYSNRLIDLALRIG